MLFRPKVRQFEGFGLLLIDKYTVIHAGKTMTYSVK